MVRKNKKITAAILVIGNEILSGRTKDQNVSYLASWLNNTLGIKLSEVRIIPDIEKKIIKSILALSKNYDYVLTTGGIGPTHDDITSQSVSKALKKNTHITKRLTGYSKIIMEKKILMTQERKWPKCLMVLN